MDEILGSWRDSRPLRSASSEKKLLQLHISFIL